MASNSKRTLYLIIILLLLLANIVIGYIWYNGSKDNEKLTVEKNELQDNYLNLQGDLNTQMAKLEEMKGTNATLDSIISVREDELKEKQAEISKLFKQKNFNARELKKAKAMMSNLEIQNTNFMTQIDSLVTLTNQLQEENQGLSTELTNQIETNSVLTEKNKELDDNNKHLGEKVEIGSLLKANELKINGIKVKSNGVEKEVNKIKRIEKIKVCYQTGNNKVREHGEVKMHLVIVTPSGKTIYNEANGSGLLTTKNGKEIRYSKEAKFDFDGKNKNVCIYWTQQLIEAGTYKAIMYNDGYLVGEASVEFK